MEEIYHFSIPKCDSVKTLSDAIEKWLCLPLGVFLDNGTS